MSDEPQDRPNGPKIHVDAEHMAGVYANFAQVSHSQYEFTLDFARVDLGQQPHVGVVVARVSVSPLFVSELIDALQGNWDNYARKALPREVQGEGNS